MTTLTYAGVFAGGGIGAVLRLLVDGLVSRRLGSRFPSGIMTVNVSGSLALGLVIGWALPTPAALVLGTGMLGAYTTFSTWILQSYQLAVDRKPVATAANIVFSLALGVAAAALGWWAGSAL